MLFSYIIDVVDTRAITRRSRDGSLIAVIKTLMNPNCWNCPADGILLVRFGSLVKKSRSTSFDSHCCRFLL
uniref:Uncharacterized protein n=1 Tax=Nelumbo nucifera TaxID=4432 RepID=A0A822Z635_NELNU|nr:TPA_asm: hypothetical protein HUJ06_014356 [Nelumbo nucifera]